MTIFRDHMRKGHRQLHRVMGVPVLYIVDEDPGPPIDMTARVYASKHGATDEIGGRNNNWMSRENIVNPTIRFMRDELAAKGIVPKRGDIVSVLPGEAYQIDRDSPTDDDSLIVHVNYIEPSDTVDLPVPESVL